MVTGHGATAVLVTAWLMTRGLVVWLLQDRHAWVSGDLAYYASSIAAVPDIGLARTLVEYPLPGVLVIALPWLLVAWAGAETAYGDAVLVLSLAADSAFTFLLARAGRGVHAGTVVWLLAVPLLGATAYARFDLVPGLLAGVSLLVLARHPRAAAASAAVATGLKLWPALLLPALAARTVARRTVLVVVVLVGGTLTTASLVVEGWDRLVSPLTWQADRGLQIEAVAATPAMVARFLAPGGHEIFYSEHNAFEISGPGSGLLLGAADLAPLAVAAFLLVLWARAFRRGHALPIEAVAWTCLGSVTLLVVTGKVLSPQYLMWLLPLAAAATTVGRGRGLRLWAAVLLVAAGLTQLVFPELYAHLVEPGDMTGRAVVGLAIRNALLVLLAGWAAVASWRAVSGAGRSSASSPDPPGARNAPAGGRSPTPS